jgi:hypothetical protein
MAEEGILENMLPILRFLIGFLSAINFYKYHSGLDGISI